MPQFTAKSHDEPQTERRSALGEFVLGWFLNAAYCGLLLLVSPLLVWRMVRAGKYREGWSQKLFGQLPVSDCGGPVAWFHAVSVGEVLQLETIIGQFAAARPDTRVIISTTTATGLGIARERFPLHTCCYFPLDFSWAVNRALNRVRPDLFVLVELELWPNFLLRASRRGVRLALINGRLSERSFHGYRRVGWLISKVLSRFEAVGVQSREYADRFTALGGKCVTVTGSIKFDRVETDRDHPRTRELREHFGISDGDLVLVAGSTQAPEEDLAIRSWMQLRDRFPSLRLIVVPRHQERFAEVAQLVRSLGLHVVRRTDSAGSVRSDDSVLLLDTLGELSHCWGMADVAFVGGSFGNRGGQNMIEPAAFGSAVLVGPNTRNFADTVSLLVRENAIVVVDSEDNFAETVGSLLSRPGDMRTMGTAAQQAVLSRRGASLKTLELVLGCLAAVSGTPSVRPAA